MVPHAFMTQVPQINLKYQQCLQGHRNRVKTYSHRAWGAPRVQALINDSTQSPRGQREDSIPDEESDDFRAKDQPSGVMDAQCGKRSSTGFRNLRPWGPHITRGLSRVSPGVKEGEGQER